MADRRRVRAGPDAGRPGWTLLECLLVVVIMAVVVLAAVPLLHSESTLFNAAEPKILTAQEARFALAHVSRALRQAWAITAVADNGAGTASFEFLASDGARTTFGREAATHRLYYGPVGSTATLARNCTGLSLACYTAGGQAMALPIANPGGIGIVEMSVTVTDPKGRGVPVTYKTQAALGRSSPTVVINEIMYKPSGALGGTDKNRWVELFNASSQPVDVGGWLLWTKDQGPPDTLVADPLFSTGSTVIQPGQFALITDTDSELFRDFLSNPDFEVGTGGWDINPGLNVYVGWGSAWSGSWRLVVKGGASTTIQQDFVISSSCAKARVVLRERISTGAADSSSLTVRVTDRHAIVYAVVYAGRFSAEWKTHALDLTPWIAKDARLEIVAYHPVSTARLDIDAVDVFGTRLPGQNYDALHLWVNDTTIGNDLSSGQLFLSQGSKLQSAVVFTTAWGGNGDGSTLSRKSPWAPATEQSSWQPGPYGGTPGTPNGGP